MKLYTEEQVRAILNLAKLSVYGTKVYSKDELLEKLTPIKLPSDRDIEIAANGNQEHYEGAMWLKHKYLTKTNNQ
jgi:hypothetical protein